MEMFPWMLFSMLISLTLSFSLQCTVHIIGYFLSLLLTTFCEHVCESPCRVVSSEDILFTGEWIWQQWNGHPAPPLPSITPPRPFLPIWGGSLGAPRPGAVKPGTGRDKIVRKEGTAVTAENSFEGSPLSCARHSDPGNRCHKWGSQPAVTCLHLSLFHITLVYPTRHEHLIDGITTLLQKSKTRRQSWSKSKSNWKSKSKQVLVDQSNTEHPLTPCDHWPVSHLAWNWIG